MTKIILIDALLHTDIDSKTSHFSLTRLTFSCVAQNFIIQENYNSKHFQFSDYRSEMGKSGSKLSPTENETFVVEVITESEDTLDTWANESC